MNDDFIGQANIQISDLKQFYIDNKSDMKTVKEFVTYGQLPGKGEKPPKPEWIKLSYGKFLTKRQTNKSRICFDVIPILPHV